MDVLYWYLVYATVQYIAYTGQVRYNKVPETHCHVCISAYPVQCEAIRSEQFENAHFSQAYNL